jgi:small subunit ribosomal protein S9
MSAETSVYLGTGRRKTSTARVRLIAGSGQLSVNDRKFDTYFTHENFVRRAIAPLTVADAKEKFDVFVNVAGGGISSQSGAVAHGIARALLKFNPELRVSLKKAGHLTRDPREKERKKAGQPGARKRFQFSKR